MIGAISKLFGGSKSEKDVKKIRPLVDQINQFFNQYQTLSNDELRNNTTSFKQRIAAHLLKINTEIADKQKAAEDLPVEDIKWLDQLAAEQGKSYGAVMRMIICWYRHHIEGNK